MAKLIIYDEKNIMIAELNHVKKIGKTANIDGKSVKAEILHAAYFKNFEIVNSERIRKNLKKIEKNAKYHKKRNLQKKG